jgi:hypothetical protein
MRLKGLGDRSGSLWLAQASAGSPQRLSSLIRAMRSPYLIRQSFPVGVHQPFAVADLPLMWAQLRWQGWSLEAFITRFFQHWEFPYPMPVHAIQAVLCICLVKRRQFVYGETPGDGSANGSDSFQGVSLSGN